MVEPDSNADRLQGTRTDRQMPSNTNAHPSHPIGAKSHHNAPAAATAKGAWAEAQFLVACDVSASPASTTMTAMPHSQNELTAEALAVPGVSRNFKESKSPATMYDDTSPA